jgi:hypothetical protein
VWLRGRVVSRGCKGSLCPPNAPTARLVMPCTTQPRAVGQCHNQPGTLPRAPLATAACFHGTQCMHPPRRRAGSHSRQAGRHLEPRRQQRERLLGQQRCVQRPGLAIKQLCTNAHEHNRPAKNSPQQQSIEGDATTNVRRIVVESNDCVATDVPRATWLDLPHFMRTSRLNQADLRTGWHSKYRGQNRCKPVTLALSGNAHIGRAAGAALLVRTRDHPRNRNP